MGGQLVERRDEIFAYFAALWANEVPAIIGVPGPLPVVYTMTDGNAVPEKNRDKKPWARVTFRVQDARGDAVGARRYRVTGELLIQLFVYGDRSNAGDRAQNTADFIARKFRRYSGSASFRNVVALDGTEDAGFKAAIVSAEFWFTQRD